MSRILEVQIHSVDGKYSVWMLVDAGDAGKVMQLFRSFDTDMDKAVSCWQTCINAVSAGAVLVGAILYVPSEVL